jgi:hypothetical protein
LDLDQEVDKGVDEISKGIQPVSREGILTAIQLVKAAVESGLLGGFGDVGNMFLVYGDEVEG